MKNNANIFVLLLYCEDDIATNYQINRRHFQTCSKENHSWFGRRLGKSSRVAPAHNSLQEISNVWDQFVDIQACLPDIRVIGNILISTFTFIGRTFIMIAKRCDLERSLAECRFPTWRYRKKPIWKVQLLKEDRITLNITMHSQAL